MTAQRYEITDAFRYERYTVSGVESGEFLPGVTGDDLTDEQRDYLETVALPAGLVTRVADTSTPPAAAAPADSASVRPATFDPVVPTPAADATSVPVQEPQP